MASTTLMIKGTITSYNARRGVGYVRHTRGNAGIPFSLRHAQDREFADGDSVEFTVRGGKAGVAAHGVRRVDPAS